MVAGTKLPQMAMDTKTTLVDLQLYCYDLRVDLFLLIFTMEFWIRQINSFLKLSSGFNTVLAVKG